MDLSDEEPRKHPVPVPFCEVMAKPTVPELSLISLDESADKPKKNEPFSGTHFQTYNSWKWKYMNGVDKFHAGEDNASFDKCNSLNNCCLITDKYSSSQTEKRKNEILYGQMEEPRQPILPKPFPEIPKFNISHCNSFDDLTLVNDSIKSSMKKLCDTNNQMMNNLETTKCSHHCLKDDSDGTKKLYSIITKQNKQIEVLEQQLEQILRLQDVKDKQISQLLKSQESKEKKIEKLLESLDGKEKEIEKLLQLKSKETSHVNELLQSQEDMRVQNIELIKKLNSLEKKESCSASTMTENNMIDCCTNTSCQTGSNSFPEAIDKMSDHDCLRNAQDTNDFTERDRSLSLHSVDLPVIQDNAPTPQGSIHLDFKDFNYLSDDSDSDRESTQNHLQPSSQINTNQLGYTFYNNIMTQVKDIIQNSSDKECQTSIKENMAVQKTLKKEKRSLVQSFQGCQILERENIPQPTMGTSDTSQNRFFHEPAYMYMKESYSPSDVSLKMNSLAMKYLKQEQILQYNLESQLPITRHPDVTIYNVTNLSFGSARMDKFSFLPNVKDLSLQNHLTHESPGQVSRRRKMLNDNAASGH